MVLDFATGAQKRKIGKSWKNHDEGTTDPEHHEECDPDHPDESKVKIWKKFKHQNNLCSGLMPTSLNCFARARLRVKRPGVVCVLVGNEKHATAVKQLRHLRPKLIVTFPGGRGNRTINLD